MLRHPTAEATKSQARSRASKPQIPGSPSASAQGLSLSNGKSQANGEIKHRKITRREIVQRGRRFSDQVWRSSMALSFLGLGSLLLRFVWVLKLGAWDLIECRPLDVFDAR
jgi:hypothetical protein